MNVNYNETGIIFDIQRSSMYDGPGIRTAVFLKGCPLSCKWCHNPESQKQRPQTAFFAQKCTSCGACIAVCPKGAREIVNGIHVFHPELCKGCGTCARHCPTGAMKQFGLSMTAEQVVQIALQDKAYYAISGGGLTLTGGEPFFQFPFMRQILTKAKDAGLHTCVETCGFSSPENILESLRFTDCYLFDFKLSDPALHKAYTGVSNERILYNLTLLLEYHADVWLRCPIIPGVNDTPQHFSAIAELERRFPYLRGIEIMPYHDLGQSKERALGKTPGVTEKTVSEQRKAEWRTLMLQCGCSQKTASSF